MAGLCISTAVVGAAFYLGRGIDSVRTGRTRAAWGSGRARARTQLYGNPGGYLGYHFAPPPTVWDLWSICHFVVGTSERPPDGASQKSARADGASRSSAEPSTGAFWATLQHTAAFEPLLLAPSPFLTSPDIKRRPGTTNSDTPPPIQSIRLMNQPKVVRRRR